jgi:hypothetical protein
MEGAWKPMRHYLSYKVTLHFFPPDKESPLCETTLSEPWDGPIWLWTDITTMEEGQQMLHLGLNRQHKPKQCGICVTALQGKPRQGSLKERKEGA